MKKFLPLALTFGLTVLSVLVAAQERGGLKQLTTNPALQVQTRIPSLACCDCLGKVTTLNISTGQGSPIDPFWKVNGNSAYTTPPYPGWIVPSSAPLSPAKWIQPVASPTPSNNVPVGDYKYTLRFNTPRCTIPSDVQLEIFFAADNSAKVYLDGSQIPTTICQTTCFRNPQAPVHVLTTVSNSPTHTLEFVVHNDGGPSGLIVNAKLTRHCARGNPEPQTETNAEPQ